MHLEPHTLILASLRSRHVLGLSKTLIRISANKLIDVVDVTNVTVDENVTVDTTYVDTNNNIFGF
jgi:hypothetical protein